MKKLYWLALFIVVLLVFSIPVSAEPFIVYSGYSVEVFMTGLTIPHDLIFNPLGDLLVSETDLQRVSIIEVLPNGTPGDVNVYGSDIPDAEGITLDSSGVLFVCDGDSVYKVLEGISTPFASGFNDPEGLAFDKFGNLFVSDDVGEGIRISKVEVLDDGSPGTVSTFAIVPTSGTAAIIEFDMHGDLFVSDNATAVWKIDILPDGSVAEVSSIVDGLIAPFGLEFDSEGNLYVGSSVTGDIWQVDPEGNVSVFASGFAAATGLAFDAKGNLFVTEWPTGSILKIVVSDKKENPKSLNARFFKWDENEHVVHLFLYENGTEITLEEGQPSLFGFEWGGGTVEELQEYHHGENHDITLTITGDIYLPEQSVKDYYQDAFYAETESGPAWTWDHDGDGPGDADLDGVGDWNGPILFFRYPHAGLSSGSYEFTFTVYDEGSFSFSDTITVIVQ